MGILINQLNISIIRHMLLQVRGAMMSMSCEMVMLNRRQIESTGTGWGPQTMVKLVNIDPTSRWFMHVSDTHNML